VETSHAIAGVVIGGGLLGLEAANALRQFGLPTHVIEMMPRLMAQQIDEAGGGLLARMIGELGISVHVRTSALARTLRGPVFTPLVNGFVNVPDENDASHPTKPLDKRTRYARTSG
jgi:NADPH-dependent 2,4-dienoyl-CoA reductase/sulfur reductase-like enzyme